MTKYMIYNPFLDIYRIVVNLNVPGWIGEDRKSANIANGLVILSLVQIAVVNDAYVVSTWLSQISYSRSYITPILVYIILILANYTWLVLYGRGDEYIRMFRSKSKLFKVTRNAIAIFIVGASTSATVLLDARQ
jgi:hypothetical protein